MHGPFTSDPSISLIIFLEVSDVIHSSSYVLLKNTSGLKNIIVSRIVPKKYFQHLVFLHSVKTDYLFLFYQKYLPVSSITKTAENFFIILCCFSTICFKVLKQTYYFFLTITLSRCQISSTYSWIVLSDVNLPLHAVLRSAFLAQPFSSLYAASTRFCASA